MAKAAKGTETEGRKRPNIRFTNARNDGIRLRTIRLGERNGTVGGRGRGPFGLCGVTGVEQVEREAGQESRSGAPVRSAGQERRPGHIPKTAVGREDCGKYRFMRQ